MRNVKALLFLSIIFLKDSSAQTWQWAIGADDLYSNGIAVATDQKGFIYSVGRGGSNISSLSCAYHGNPVIKADSLGNILWVRTFWAGFFLPDTKVISVDLNGNCY